MPKYGQLFFESWQQVRPQSLQVVQRCLSMTLKLKHVFKAIEAEIASIKEGLANHSHVSSGGGGSTQEQLDELIAKLGKKMSL